MTLDLDPPERYINRLERRRDSLAMHINGPDRRRAWLQAQLTPQTRADEDHVQPPVQANPGQPPIPG